MERRGFYISSLFLWDIFGLFHPQEKLMPVGKYFMEEGIIIIQISKEEALTLNKRHKVKFGVYGGISTTHTKRHKKYFLTESVENMKYLSQIRKAEHQNSIVRGNIKSEKVGG